MSGTWQLKNTGSSHINCQNAELIFKRFRGVVGYHIRLTRGRSPVRTRTKTNSFSLIILQEISEFEHKTSIYHLCALFLRAERGQSLRDTKYDFVDDHLFEWNTCKATLWSTHRLTERGRKKLGVENGVFFVKTHWHNKKESLGDRPCRWEVTLTHFFSA